MATLQDTNRLLQNATDSLKTYSAVFNTASKEVTADVDYMGKSIDELRNALNSLLSDANKLNALGKSININDKGQVEDYTNKVKELDKTLSGMVTSISGSIKELNSAFVRTFKLDDGTTGQLKEQLNELVRLYSDISTLSEVKHYAPDLGNFAENFKTQVDQIEYQMGRITEFGKGRSETDKALGFVVEEKDIADIKEAKKAERKELDDMVKSWGLTKGLADPELNDQDVKEKVETIDRYVSQLDASVGKKIKGYIDMFNEANNTLKAGQANQNKFNVVGDYMSRQMYEGVAGGKVDWNKVTNADLNNWETKLNSQSSGIFDDFITQAPKVTTSFEDIQKVVADTKEVTKEYGDELQKIISEASVLSDEQKSGILGADYSKKIDSYKQNIQYLENELKTLGLTALHDMPETKLDLNNVNEASKLVDYKANIEAATESLEILKTQQADFFRSAADPKKLVNRNDVIDRSELNKISGVLESGYKVNLLEGSTDKEKLDQLREGFKQLIDNFKVYKFNIIPDSELENLAKINTLQDKIKSETKIQEENAKAQAAYEKNKADYITKQNELLQAQANLKALTLTRDTLLKGASSVPNIDATRQKKDEHGNPMHNPSLDPVSGDVVENPIMEHYRASEKDLINERYNSAIAKENSTIARAQNIISKLTEEFNKHKLEIPITPVIDKSPNLSGDLRKDYLGIRRTSKDELFGDLGKYDNDLKQTSQRAGELGLNIDKSNSKIQAIGNTIKSAFNSGDIDRAKQLLEVYGAEVNKLKDKVDGQAKAQDVAADRQKNAIRGLFEETKNYVSTQEALSNKPMSYDAQAAYYEKQLPKFAQGTREYIEVLKLKNQAENKAAEETKKAAEAEEKAHLEALEAAKQRVSGMLNAIKSLADGLNSAVNKIVQIIRTGISAINKIISGATKFIVNIGRGIRSIITLFGNLGNRVKSSLLGASEGSEKVNGSFNILKGSATELRSKLLLLKGAFDGLFNSEMVKKADNLMASVYSLKNIAGSNITQEVLDWANAMEYAFGISAKELIGDINELTGVLYGLGMNAKDTALGSENILMMSRYLAFMGAAGGDVNEVMNKLVSGMKGMTQAIDDLGLSVREAQMNSFLKSLKAQGGEYANIATDFTSLNEQARVYVRYASLIDQFTRNYDITNFADALTTVTGRMQILRQSVSSLITTLGTGLNKVLANLATYLIPVIKLIEQLVTRIFAFFGIDVTMTTDINEGTDALSGLGDGLDDTKDKLDKVSDSAKKAGGNLQSFDRINNVSSSESKSGKGGDDDFDYRKLMASMLDNLNDLASKASVSYSDKLLENFKNKLAEMKQSLVDFAKDITGREDFNLGFDWSKIKENLKTIFDNIVATLKSWGTFVIEIVLKVADDANIGLIITKLTDLLAKASEVAKVLTDVLIPAFRAFYDIALSPIVKYIGEEVVKAIDFMIAELDKWQGWLTDNKENILQFFTDLAEIVNATWEVIRPFLDASWGKLGDSISELGEKLRDALNSLMSSTNEKKPAIIEWIQTELPNVINSGIVKIKEFWDALRGDESVDTVAKNQGTIWGEFLQIIVHLSTIAQALVPIIKDLAGAFGEFAKNELLPWLNEKLGELGEWLNQNKDKIVDFINKIASATWEGFKLFVDLLGKLIDYVVQNPDSVFKFFEALIGLKVASWFTSTAASIGMALVGLKSLASFASGAGGALSGLFGGAGAAGAGATGEAVGGAVAAGSVALGPILAVVAAVVALIAVVKDLWDTSESFRQAITDIWNNIVESFNNAKERISKAFSNIGEAWDNFYQAYENSNLKDIVEFLVTLIAEYLGGAVSGVITLIGNLFSAIGNLLSDIINIVSGVLDVLGGLANIIVGVFTIDGEKISQGWGELVTGLVEIVQGLIQGIIDVVGGVVGAFIDVGSSLIGGLGKGISDAWHGFVESVRSLFDGWIQAVKDFFGIHSPSRVFAEIGDFLVQGLLQGIQDAWAAFSEAVIGLFNGLIDGIKNTFSGIGEFFSGTFNKAKELAVGAWNNANEKFTEVKNRVVGAFDSLKENIRTTFATAKDNAVSVWNDAKGRFANVADNIASGLSSVKSKAKQIFTDVKNNASSILSEIGTQLSSTWEGVKSRVSSGWNYITGNTKATTGRKITSHAVGGSIAGGQLFIANENGNAELIGNIDGSGKTNVANNNMIMQAMESGIFEAVYNAMAEVMNQRGTVGSSGNTTIKLDGFGLIDASTLRELARILAPYLKSNDINIADTQFSI